MNPKRRRVKAYVDALSRLILSEDPSREEAIELVRQELERERVEPFRGASKPADIYEKELISLYIVASRGLGIGEEYGETMAKVFEKEEIYDKVIKVLLSGVPTEEVRETIRALMPELSDSEVARILRYALTLHYLDFEPWEKVVAVIKRFLEAFPEHEETIRRFSKFVIAVEIAEEIAKGKIRSKVDKEIRKQVLSLEVGIPKSTPSDEYIAKIAREVFEVPQKVLNKIFKQQRGKRRRAYKSKGPSTEGESSDKG